MLAVISFYVLSFVAIGAAIMVVAARNPVHSVMYLILTFFSAAGLFVLMGAEFLALLLVMVYVGAVAVLFLFVVMMLDIDFDEMKKGVLQHLPLGLLVAVIMLAELIMLGAGSLIKSGQDRHVGDPSVSNIKALGNVLYTDYAFFFEAVGLILLVAMIGAIVLTHRTRKDVKRQNISKQIARTREDGVHLVDVEPNQGIGQ